MLFRSEAIHGDLGKLVEGDLVLALSYSGETEELLRLLERIKRLGIPLIGMTGGLKSTLARASDVLLDVSIRREACPLNLAPTASTTAALALGAARRSSSRIMLPPAAQAGTASRHIKRGLQRMAWPPKYESK